MTGSQVNSMKSGDKKFKQKNPNDIFKIEGKKVIPEPIMTAEQVIGDELREFERGMDHMAGLDPGYSNLFHQTVKDEVKVYNTKEEAQKAAGENGKVVAGVGKNKGKFIIK